MEKKLEEMNEQELLRELIKRQDRQARITWIVTAGVMLLAAVMLICALALVPKLTTTLDKTRSTMEQAYVALDETRAMIAQAQEQLTQLDGLVESAEQSLVGIDEMVENMNKLVVENTDGLHQTLEKLNDINFDKLNKSIDDFNKLISPLSKLFGGRD